MSVNKSINVSEFLPLNHIHFKNKRTSSILSKHFSGS